MCYLILCLLLTLVVPLCFPGREYQRILLVQPSKYWDNHALTLIIIHSHGNKPPISCYSTQTALWMSPEELCMCVFVVLLTVRANGLQCWCFQGEYFLQLFDSFWNVYGHPCCQMLSVSPPTFSVARTNQVKTITHLVKYLIKLTQYFDFLTKWWHFHGIQRGAL